MFVCPRFVRAERERERERNKTRVFFADFIRSCLSFVPLFGTSSSSLFLFFCDRKKERYFEIHIKREYIECERKEESFGKRDRGYFCSSRSSSEGFVRAERGRNTIDALSSSSSSSLFFCNFLSF